MALERRFRTPLSASIRREQAQKNKVADWLFQLRGWVVDMFAEE